MRIRGENAAGILLVTVPDEELGGIIARALVQERLAACVNMLGPVRSVFRWQGAIGDEREFLLLIKSRASLYRRIEKRVRELHTYETPEIIALPIVAGSHPYLKWLLGETTGAVSRRRPKKPGPIRQESLGK
jgi:periplasmic divalent cation tolerance protein